MQLFIVNIIYIDSMAIINMYISLCLLFFINIIKHKINKIKYTYNNTFLLR